MRKVNGAWTPYKDFFLPVRALSRIYRAKFRDGMKKLNLYDSVPAEVWKKEWVVHSEPAGQGPEAIKYLSKYIYRVAITNSRIISLNDGTGNCRVAITVGVALFVFGIVLSYGGSAVSLRLAVNK